MKNYLYYILAVVLLSTSTELLAQDDSNANQGRVVSNFIGGTLSFRSEIRDRDNPATLFYEKLSVDINPYIGKAFSASFSAGAFLSYTYQNLAFLANGPFQDEFRIMQSYGAGLFVRNYLNDGAFRFFIESQLSYSRIKEYSEGPTINVVPRNRDLIALVVRPSVSYRIKRIRILAYFGSLSYSNFGDSTFKINNEKRTADEGYSVFLFNLRPRNIALGAEFLF